MKPRAILIDWDGTLSTSRFWGHWKTDRPNDYESIQTQLFASSDQRQLIHDWMRGRYSAAQVLERMAPLLRHPADELLTHLEQSCRTMTFIDPGLPALLQTLRGNGYLVAIATDNMDTFTRWTVPSLQLATFVDEILNSHQIGLLKGDTETDGSLPFFADFMNEHKLTPANCVIVDDSQKLQPLAVSAGFTYHQVTPQHSIGTVLKKLASLQPNDFQQ